jgi:predicted  nucleic acid-binding Zn-ribbon protein
VFRGKWKGPIAAAVASMAFSLGTFLPAEASPPAKLGQECPNPGMKAKPAKQKPESNAAPFLCVETVAGPRWARPEGLPKGPPAARKMIETWLANLSSPTFDAIGSALQAPIEGTQAELGTAVQAREEWNSKLSAAQAKAASLRSEQAGLPGRITTAQQATDRAKAEVEPKMASARQEMATLTSMMSAYSAAQSAKTAALGPGLRCSFGEKQYCAQAAALEAQLPWANSVIARYEIQRARAESLLASAAAAQKTYETRYAEYKAAFDRQNSIQAEIASATNDINHAQGMLNQATGKADFVNEQVALFPELNRQYEILLAQNQDFAAQVSTIAVGSPGWQSRFTSAAERSASLELSRQAILDMWSRFAQ